MSTDPARALKALESSILFAPDFPRRVSFTHEEYLALARARNEEKVFDAGIMAIRRARDVVRPLQECVQLLGEAHWEPAIPVLVRLWAECALTPVRIAVGRALFEFGTPETMAALVTQLEDHDYFGRYMALMAVFAQGSGAAYDYLDRRFGIVEGKHWVLKDVFGFLDGSGPGPEPSENERDPRWLIACARLRRHPLLGSSARRVLLAAEVTERQQALAGAREAERSAPPPRIRREGSLLQRYQGGEHEAVWREIRAYGSIAGELREEVLEVAECAMQTVARNTGRVTQRLRDLGWKPLYGELHTLPQAGDAADFEDLAAVSEGPIPPTLLAFWQVVGGINWVWDYEQEGMPNPGFDLPLQEQDALCVDPPSSIAPCLKEWRERNSELERDLRDPVQIHLAPDFLHKANISGGMPYGIELPFEGADPELVGEAHGLPFLDYLRLAFRWAGFPGLERHAQLPEVRDFVLRMGRDLEPF